MKTANLIKYKLSLKSEKELEELKSKIGRIYRDASFAYRCKLAYLLNIVESILSARARAKPKPKHTPNPK